MLQPCEHQSPAFGHRDWGSGLWACSSLASITLPPSVIKIGEDAFARCSNLIEAEGPVYAISKLPKEQLTSFVISDGVKNIGFAAFYGCSNLRNISIPESILKIRNLAFSGCSRLTEVRIPKGCDVQRFAFELFSNTKIIRY